MDSFEAKLQFTQMLKTLTPSSMNLLKCAHFAIRNQDLEEYLHTCILEVLDTIDMNARSNVFSFLEILIQQSFYFSEQPKSTFHYPYISQFKKSSPQIILKVLPPVKNGLINLHNTFHTLKLISKQLNYDYSKFEDKFNSNLLKSEDMRSIDAELPFVILEHHSDELTGAWEILVDKKKQSQYERQWLLKYGDFTTGESDDNLFGLDTQDESKFPALSKKQILNRMEADREGHKKAKEGLWQVERKSGLSEGEFSDYWDRIRVFDDDDYDDLKELNRIADDSYQLAQF